MLWKNTDSFKKRKGSIRREFPSEFLKKTLKQIDKEAKQGNAKAKKAKKLLQDGRFKKWLVNFL